MEACNCYKGLATTRMQNENSLPSENYFNPNFFEFDSLFPVIPNECINIRYDAAFQGMSGEAAAGTIAWDSEGKVVGAGTRSFRAKSAEEAEMVAAEVALGLALLHGWTAVYIEGDCLEVTKALNGQTCSWKSESLRDYVVKLSSNFAFCKFKWITRRSNGEAHLLAQWAFHKQQMDQLPLCILQDKLIPVLV